MYVKQQSRINTAVVIIATVKEIRSERLLQFVECFFIKTRPCEKDKINMHIFVNGFFILDKQLSEQIKTMKKHCKLLRLHFLSINEKDNKYTKQRSRNQSIYGLSSGPNLSFFKSAKIISKFKYDFFLLLELDCKALKNFWLDELREEFKPNTWVTGSRYKGGGKRIKKSKHLNGVAIYRNSKELHNILKDVKVFIAEEIKNQTQKSLKRAASLEWMITDKSPKKIQEWLEKQKNLKSKSHIKLNYDVALSKYIQLKFGDQVFEKKLLNSDYISDFSLKKDSSLSVTEILKEYPRTVILHQK
jgi:hypothetical protein